MHPLDFDLLEFDDGSLYANPVHPRIFAYVKNERRNHGVPSNHKTADSWIALNNEIMRTIPSGYNRLDIFVERQSIDRIWDDYARLSFEGLFAWELEYMSITPNEDGTAFRGVLGWAENMENTVLHAFQESNPMVYKIYLNGESRSSGVMVLLGNDGEFIRRLTLNGPQKRGTGEGRELERHMGHLAYENGMNGFEFPVRSHGLLQKDSTNAFCRSSGLLPFHLNPHFQDSVAQVYTVSPPEHRETRSGILEALRFRKRVGGGGPFQQRRHMKLHPLAFPLPRTAWYDSDEESSDTEESEHSSEDIDYSRSTGDSDPEHL
jgi:hypothetical protein